MEKLDARGTKLLIRLKDNLILRSIQRLPDGSFLAKIYPSPQDRDKDRDGIIVRVIEYTLNDPERTGHGETHRLATKERAGNNFLISSWRFVRVSRPRRLLDRRSPAGLGVGDLS